MNMEIKNIQKVTSILEGNARVTKVFSIGPVLNPAENDYFNVDFNNIFAGEYLVVEEGSHIELKNAEKYKCFYYDTMEGNNVGLLVKTHATGDAERYFYFAAIQSSCDRNSILALNGDGIVSRKGRIKIWLNGKFIFGGKNNEVHHTFIHVKLKEGHNTVVIEQIDSGNVLNIRFIEELRGSEGDFLKEYINDNTINRLRVVRYNFENSLKHEFMVVPGDFINIQDGHKLSVTVKRENGKEYGRFDTEINKKIEYDLQDFHKKYPEDVIAIFQIAFLNSFGEEFIIQDIAGLQNVANGIMEIENEYINICKELEVKDEDKINIESRLRRLKNLNDPSEFIPGNKEIPQVYYEEKKELSVLVDYIKKGFHFEDYIKAGGTNNVYYRSELDNAIEHYTVYLPKNYYHKKSYPLVLFIPTGRYDDLLYFLYDKKYKELAEEEVIVAVVSVRGVTFGSYIGEAAFMETFQKLRESYSIDEDRVYLSGYCGAADAVWTMAQNFPYLFAAIAPIGGTPNINNIKNLLGMPILFINDYVKELKDSIDAVKAGINPQNDKLECHFILNGATHHTICTFLYTDKLIKWLLKHKRSKYPNMIFFRTERIRHNKTHWIEIDNFEEGKSFAEVGLLVNNGRMIFINPVNVKHFTLTVPDNIMRNNVQVIINQKKIFSLEASKFNGSPEYKIGFKMTDSGYEINEDMERCSFSNSSFGMGIFDIFMDKLKIVIPSEYESEEERKWIEKIAQNFSSPRSTAVNDSIFVTYPVIGENSVTKDDINNYNIILLGKFTNQSIHKIMDKLPLKFREDGYEYDGKFNKGSYCIMLICPNPDSLGKKVLVVCYNDYTLLKMNTFLRKINIPTYLNGLHPYLSKELVIFNGKEFFTASL